MEAQYVFSQRHFKIQRSSYEALDIYICIKYIYMDSDGMKGGAY